MIEAIMNEPVIHTRAQPLEMWSLALFDGAAAAHRLPAGARQLLLVAADCYVAAGSGDADQIARRARDLALIAPIAGLTPDEQAMAAGAAALQREKARPRREPALLRLEARDQKAAVRLAAILKVARALSAEPPGGLLVQVDGDATTLAIGGARAADLVEAAAASGDLWCDSIGPLTIRPAEPGEAVAPLGAGADGYEPASLHEAAPPDHLDGGEPIAEGARRILRRFFGRMLAREDAVIKDDDPEDVHQMRVASRRLRAALQVVEGVYAPDQIRRYRRGLRRVAQALGDVRDLDVFREHVLAYLATLPEEARAEIAPLVAAVEEQRTQVRATLLDDLDERRYHKFKRAFAGFLTTPGEGLDGGDEVDATTRVRDFAGSAIWRRYEQWRAHEVALAHPTDEGLHQARIAGKRLRYTLEFFAEALGPNIEQALAPLTALQECLGALQDSVVARQRVRALGLDEHAGVRAYLEARDAEGAARLETLPRLWEKVGSATYRRRLFEMIVKL
jgi:CHAD domain-containing protein